MIFLVGIDTPNLGSRLLGFVESGDRKVAQHQVMQLLVSAGIPEHAISWNATNNSTLHIRLHTIVLTPIDRFDAAKAAAVAALL